MPTLHCKPFSALIAILLVNLAVCGAFARSAQKDAVPSASNGAAASTVPQTMPPPAAKSAPPAASASLSFSADVTSLEAWKILTDGVTDKDADHRAEAIAALGAIGVRPSVVRLVESGLDDKSTTVRQLTAKTLGDMKSRRSIPRLRTALEDESPLVVYAAAQALWSLGDRKSQIIFIEVLQGDRKTSRGTIGEGLHFASEKLHDPGALAQLGAQQAAGAFLGPAGLAVVLVEELAKDKSAPARAASARLLGDSTAQESRDALEEAIREDKSWLVRASAAEALGMNGSKNSIAKLKPLLEDDHHEVRYKAAAAIVRIAGRQ